MDRTVAYLTVHVPYGISHVVQWGRVLCSWLVKTDCWLVFFVLYLVWCSADSVQKKQNKVCKSHPYRGAELYCLVNLSSPYAIRQDRMWPRTWYFLPNVADWL